LIYGRILKTIAEPRFFLGKFFKTPLIGSSTMLSNEVLDRIEILAKNRIVLEYGGGGSTNFLSSHALKIVSIETDKKFAQSLGSINFSNKNCKVLWADVGVTKSYGQPINFLKPLYREKWLNYPSTPWGEFPDFLPTLVLVDGRFRVASAITCYLRILVPFEIIIDDYKTRPEYHSIERLFGTPAFLAKSGTAFFSLKSHRNTMLANLLLQEFSLDPR
jgi:hypothetical protein